MRKKVEKSMAELKADYDLCIKALIRSNFNRDKAAKSLNISRRTLYSKFKAFEEAGLHLTTEAA